MQNDVIKIPAQIENPMIARLCEEAERDLTLLPQNITQKSLADSAISLKWWKILQSAHEKLKKAKHLKDNGVESYWRKHMQIGGKPKAIVEREALNSEDILKMTENIDQMLEVVGFLNGLYQIFAKHGYSIKNSLELLKLEKNL